MPGVLTTVIQQLAFGKCRINMIRYGLMFINRNNESLGACPQVTLACGYGLQSLIDPLSGVSGAFVGGDEAVSNELRIKGFLATFTSYLCQPELERFSFL